MIPITISQVQILVASFHDTHPEPIDYNLEQSRYWFILGYFRLFSVANDTETFQNLQEVRYLAIPNSAALLLVHHGSVVELPSWV